MKYISFILFIFLSVVGKGQKNSHLTDSALYFIEQSMELSAINPDSAILLGYQAMDLATQAKLDSITSAAHYVVGAAISKTGNLTLSDSLLNIALEIEKKKPRPSYMARIYRFLADSRNTINPDQAIEYLDYSIYWAKQHPDKRLLADAYLSMANSQDLRGNRDVAVDNFITASEIFDSIGYALGAAMVNANLGNVFFDSKDYEKALQYNLKGQTYANEAGDSILMARIDALRISILAESGKLDEALDLAKDNLSFWEAKITLIRKENLTVLLASFII